MKVVSAILAAFCLFSFGAATDSRAEESPDIAELSIEQLMEIEIVTTASRFEQKVTEAPSSISIITADDIKRYGYRTLADLLRSIRGLYVTSDRHHYYLGVRGFNRPGDYGSRVLLLVDGIRQNEPIFESTAIGYDFTIDVDLIERVEVARGPSSSIYGGNALFAVINVITRKAQEFKGAEASAEYGSFDAYKTSFTYGNIFKNDVEAVISGSYYDSKGDDRIFFKEFDDPATNNGIAEDLDHAGSNSFMGKLSVGDLTLESAYNKAKKGIPTASFGTFFNDDRFFVSDESFFTDLKYERGLENDVRVMARLNYNVFKYYGDYPYDPVGAGLPSDVVVNRDEAYGNWWGGEVQLDKRFSERHRMLVGGEFRDNIKQQQKNYDPGVVYLDDVRRSTVSAAYVQDEFGIAKGLILNAGVRYDDYSTFGSTTNPRMALIYGPFEKTTFKLLYGTAFRPPNIYESYFQQLPYFKANSDLMPESINTYELACEQYIGSRFRGTVNLFHYRIEDLITQTVDPADNMLVYKNAGEAEAKGVEFELEGKLEKGVTGRISYTYQEAKDKETGDILYNSPRHLTKANLVLPLMDMKIFLGIEEQYTSERKTIQGNEAPSFYITNLTLSSESLYEGLELSASVYNLFDYEYVDPVGEELVQDTIQQDGRRYRVKATYKF